MSHPGKQYQEDGIERLSSSDDERAVHVTGRACAARDHADACAELVYELDRVLGGMLVNAQVMQWKLPPYSHSKRYLREIERAAQRGGALVQQLLRHLGAQNASEDEFCGEAPSLAGKGIAVTAQEPKVAEDVLAAQYRTLSTHAAPVFSRTRRSRTHTAV